MWTFIENKATFQEIELTVSTMYDHIWDGAIFCSIGSGTEDSTVTDTVLVNKYAFFSKG